MLWVADQKQLDKMAGVCLLAFIAGLLLETYGLPVEIKEKHKEERQQCSVNNGGCSHFCVMQAMIPVCRCAAGYRLGPDKKTCEPTGQLSCGRFYTPASSATSYITPQSFNSKSTLVDDHEEDISQSYDPDYFKFLTEDSDLSNISMALRNRSVGSDSSSSVNPAGANIFTEILRQLFPPWSFFPTLPTITAKDNTDQTTVGGDEAHFEGIPWQVALMAHPTAPDRARVFCGGSLLSELWVVTAASCLPEYDTNINFFIRVGEHDVYLDEGPERDHAVAKLLIHPMFNITISYNHDIALVKLASPVELSSQRRPICLGPKDFTETILRESVNSLVSGWGRLSDYGRPSPTLKKLELPYVDRTACERSSKDEITLYMFCSGFADGSADACQGDGGGPHATNYKGTWFLTGIISWGEGCARKGKYGVYTRVSRYHKWISETTGIPINN